MKAPVEAGGAISEVSLPIASLRGGYSPRAVKSDPLHAKLLSQATMDLPPILVNRETMEVIDGNHRILAAQMRGDTQILVRFFNGSPVKARMAGIWANVRHGKPLTLSERESAANALIGDNPELSDRVVAQCCGIAPNTVKRLRGCSTAQGEQLRRTGRDGRRRPTDPAASRQRIAEVIDRQPTATIREVCVVTGASPNTVRAVRRSMAESPVSKHERTARQLENGQAPSPRPIGEVDVLNKSHQYAEWIQRFQIANEDWVSFVADIPLGRVYEIADAARRIGSSWDQFAGALERRARNPSRGKDISRDSSSELTRHDLAVFRERRAR
jgi:hypothetical protein